MPYNPGVTDISGQLQARGMAQGMDRLLEGFDSGLKTYQQNKHIADTGITKFGAAVAANNALKALLTDENQRATLPPDVVRAYLKLQKDGSLGARDATLLGGFADGFVKTSEEQQQQALRTQQMDEISQRMAASKQARDLAREQGVREKETFDRDVATNNRFQKMVALSQEGLPSEVYVTDPDDPVAVAAREAEDRAHREAVAFMDTSAGKAAAQGVYLSSKQVTELGLADLVNQTRLSASELAANQRTAAADLRAANAEAKLNRSPVAIIADIDAAEARGEISSAEAKELRRNIRVKAGTVVTDSYGYLTRNLTDPPPPAPGAGAPGAGAPGAGAGAPGAGAGAPGAGAGAPGAGAPGAGAGAPGAGAGAPGAGAGAPGAGPKTYPVYRADQIRVIPLDSYFLNTDRELMHKDGDGTITRVRQNANPPGNVRTIRIPD